MAELKYEIIIVDSVEDAESEGKPYKKVLDTAGTIWNFRAGQYDKLKAKWSLLIHGATLRLLLGKYKGYDYIEDFDTIVDALTAEKAKREAASKRQSKEGSIEAQTAIKAITDLQISKTEIPEDIIDARDAWLRYALKNFLGIQKEGDIV